MFTFGFRKSTWQSCWAEVPAVICGHCVFISTDFFFFLSFLMGVYLLPYRFDNILFSCFFRLWACAVWLNKGHAAMHRFTDFPSWCSITGRNQGKELQFKNLRNTRSESVHQALSVVLLPHQSACCWWPGSSPVSGWCQGRISGGLEEFGLQLPLSCPVVENHLVHATCLAHGSKVTAVQWVLTEFSRGSITLSL